MESGSIAKKTNYLVSAVVLAYLVSQFLVEIILGKKWIERNIYIFLAFIQLFVILLPALLFMYKKKMSMVDVLRIKRVTIPEILLVIPMSILSSFIASVLNSIVIFLLGKNYSMPTGGIPVPLDNSQLYIQIIVVALIPSVCEEIFFRGIIFYAFKGMDIWKSIIVSSFYFSLFHFDIRNLLGPFFLGVLIAWYCYRTGSIFPGIIAHFTNNLMLVLINWFNRSVANDPLNLTANVIWELTVFAAITGIVLIILIRGFRTITKNKVIQFVKSNNKLQLTVITQWPMCFFYGVYIVITVLILLHNTI